MTHPYLTPSRPTEPSHSDRIKLSESVVEIELRFCSLDTINNLVKEIQSIIPNHTDVDNFAITVSHSEGKHV